MLHMVTRVSLKELQLYERLKLLRTLLKKQPDRFDCDKIRDITAAAVFDAGLQIFSLCQEHSVTDHGFQCFQDNSAVIWAEVLDEKVVEINFSKTNVLGFLDFLLEDYLREVNSSKVDSNTLSCVPKIREHLVFLKSIMGKLAELRNQHENLNQHVWNLGVAVAYKIEFLIDQLVLGDVLDSFSMSLQSITEDIMIVNADYLDFFTDQGRQEILKVQQITCPSTDKFQTISSSDEVVGFEIEKASTVNRLMSGFKKLQVVAVVGMPGLGKTTFATKVYRDSSITHHFHVKAWCSISQVFDRRKVLLKLLTHIQPGESNLTTTDDDLSQKLWRSLKKRRYLIFLDDIWDTKAFDLLKESLPDDYNQSRILLTSRHDGIVPEALLDEKPLFLRHFTLDESLELLQRELFPTQKDWPLESHEIAVEIAKYCKGLPLTVVVMAGLLKTTEHEDWKDILKALRLSIISETKDQCESTIELSYKHLPDHLKPCFLWFGAFPEDHELSVKSMTRLWIAEGIVQKNESKSLEEVSRDYMNSLIGRSLVMNVRRRSAGGVKTCRIHDLLHDFCLRKGNEEFFLRGSTEKGGLSSYELETSLIDEAENLPSVELRNLRRLCVYSKPAHLKCKVFCPQLRSLLFFRPTEWGHKLDLSYIFSMFMLLRVLDIGAVKLTGFPCEIGALTQLRYLVIQVDEYVGPAIGNLSNLETLILTADQGGTVSLPDTLWNMQKLRHLDSKVCSIELTIDNSDNSCKLLELETLSTLRVLDWSIVEKQLKKFPNIRRMKCHLNVHKVSSVPTSLIDSKAIDFSFLSQLESLSLSCIYYGIESRELIFPEKINKLNFRGTNFPSNKIACIAKLPYLEVLKLLEGSFLGEFPNLKFLKLRYVDLVNWTSASDDLFPNLEKLVLQRCYGLKGIPECLKYVANFDTIEVIYCSNHVVSLLKSVKEFQNDVGNSALRMMIDRF